MKNQYNLAVAGATGLVGEAMIDILAEREFPIGTLHALASPRSAGKSILFKGKKVVVQDLAEFDFNDVDIALFSAGASVSESHVPRATDAGCVVIDNTSRFRNEPDIPLVVPEVNAAALAEYEHAVREVREEAERDRKQRAASARDENASVTAAARAEVEVELQRATSELEATLVQSREGLRAEAENLASEAAARVLGRTL